MSLKDLTKEKHTEAERTAFMQAVFKKTLSRELWIDWTYQKSVFYTVLESLAEKQGLLVDLPDIQRSMRLREDFNEMKGNGLPPRIRPEVLKYNNYLLSIGNDSQKLLAHLYTWHLGDMYGGQMIKQFVPGPHRNLEFENLELLMQNIRAKITDDLAPEANNAFQWAINMMNGYNNELNLEQNQ